MLRTDLVPINNSNIQRKFVRSFTTSNNDKNGNKKGPKAALDALKDSLDVFGKKCLAVLPIILISSKNMIINHFFEQYTSKREI